MPSAQCCTSGAETGVNLDELEQAIVQAAAALPHITRTVPRRWLKIREQLQSLGQPYIARTDYLARAAEVGMTATEANSCAVVGHTLGWWVYYDTDPELRELLVLKGDWLSTAVAHVMDDLPTRQYGMLDHSRLPAIWQNPNQPPSRHYPGYLNSTFIHLMDRFDIAYPAPSKPNHPPISVIPQLLPSTIPNLDHIWDSHADLPQASAWCRPVVKNTTEIAAPEGVMPRFIARNHWYSLGVKDLDRAIHWRTGVVLENRYGTRALVRQESSGISIRAHGPYPAEFVRALLESLRELITDFWPGLSTQVLLPCTTCGADQAFDIDGLYSRLEKPKHEAECQSCHDDVSISQLLDQLPNARPGHLDAELAELREQLRALGQQLEANATSTAELVTVRAIAAQADANLQTPLHAIADQRRFGPSLFTAVPMGADLRHPSITHIRVRITLYCEHSKKPVHVLEGDETTGIIDLKVPKEWWTKAAPWIQRVATVLSIAAPVFSSALQLSYDEPAWAGIEEQIGLGEAIISAGDNTVQAITAGADQLPDDGADPTVLAGPHRAEGGDLRQFHELLREKDPSHSDLRLVRGPGGYLWVHRSFEHHYTAAVSPYQQRG